MQGFFFLTKLIFTRDLCISYLQILPLPWTPVCCGSKHRTEWPQIMEVFSEDISVNEFPHILIGSDRVEVSTFCLQPLTGVGEDF